MSNEDLATKYARLQRILADLESVAVAFSGGVDSTLLLKAACDQLGPDKVLALTATSPVFAGFEFEESQLLVNQFGVRQQVVAADMLQELAFTTNGPRRCYHCKLALFQQFVSLAAEAGCAVLVDGSNLDDLNDYRPGRAALQELQVRSPLIEAGLGKDEIRLLSKDLGLKTWNKPPLACLASRFPYGTEITAERLVQVERCEVWLQQHNFSNYRVRYHQELARVELPEAELDRLLQGRLRQQLVAEFKAAGFTYVTLDLQGYRTGSLNETLPERD